METRTQLVVDADVLIHFSKGRRLLQFASIFPEFDVVILDEVYSELEQVKFDIDRLVEFGQKILRFPPPSNNYEMLKEYAILNSDRGKGESACMAYCYFTKNTLASSNLLDIKEYCQNNDIRYLTTMDCLYYAKERGILTEAECNEFIAEVKSKGSKLPGNTIKGYKPNITLDKSA